MIAFVVRASDRGYAFRIIAAIQKTFDRTRYTLEIELSECAGISVLIDDLKFIEMVFENLLDNIFGFWFNPVAGLAAFGYATAISEEVDKIGKPMTALSAVGTVVNASAIALGPVSKMIKPFLMNATDFIGDIP